LATDDGPGFTKKLATPDLAMNQKIVNFLNLGLGILLTMKKKLAAADWLIDQFVYCLCGVMEEEVAIVGGRRSMVK